MMTRKKLGYTILEILFVIILLGVILGSSFVSYRTGINRTRNMEAQNILYSIYTAQMDYRRENGAFTTNEADLDITIPPMKHFTLQDISTGTDIGTCVTDGLAELRSIATPAYDLWIDASGQMICEVSGSCTDPICIKMGLNR